MNLIGGLFLSVLTMQCTSMNVNQAFLTNLYSGGLEKFDGHNFFSKFSICRCLDEKINFKYNT